MKLIPYMYLVSVMAERWPRAHNSLSLCPLIEFQIFPFSKIFVTDFSGTMKARKLKVLTNMDNDLMYHVYRSRSQGSINLGVMSLGRFSKN